MKASLVIEIKIKPEYTSHTEILSENIAATINIAKDEIKLSLQLEKDKYIFKDAFQEHKSFNQIFFEVVSVIKSNDFTSIKNVIFNERDIISHSITNSGSAVEMYFSTVEFDTEDSNALEDEIFCMYYDNMPSYRDFYNQYTHDQNTFSPTFKFERKNQTFIKLSEFVSIRPEIHIDIKDEVLKTTYFKESFINIQSSLDAVATIQHVYTLDLIFSFYYRKKVKANFIKYLVNKKGKIVYCINNNSETKRFATFHLGMQNKFILLYNINFEFVHEHSEVFSDIVNIYNIAAPSQDRKSKFILFYSVLELLKENFGKDQRANFNFKDIDLKEYFKTCLTHLAQFLVVESDDTAKTKLKSEIDMLTGQAKIDYLSNNIIYKPMKRQFDTLMEKYPLTIKKYGVDLVEITKLRSRLFHGGSLKDEDLEHLAKISNHLSFPRFISELISKVMGADPENYNYNIYEE